MPPQRWYCPNCNAKAVTDNKVPMHHCPGTRGLMTPLVKEGAKVKIEVVERQDFVGRELVQTDEHGRPVMSVVTTRDDGQDCTVFAPTSFAERDSV